MKLLQLIPTIDPAAGGPSEGVRHLSLQLIEMGHLVEVVTLDSPASEYVRSFPVPCHALGPSGGVYRYNARLVDWLVQRSQEFDAVIVNGLWQYPGLAAWRASRRTKVPYYVYTHGMLDPWFKRRYPLKHLKKWLYWPWAEYRVLRDATAVLFTCAEEQQLARTSFWLYRANERVVSYGTREPPLDAAHLREDFLIKFSELRGNRILLFLSRLHEKKGCDMLLRAFAHVADSDPQLRLVMAGPDQSGLTPGLQEISRSLGIADRISWTGMLQGNLKWGAFYSSEAFILPSHQENFGIAVAESLGCSVPVLISDKVNIWRESDADEAGFVEPDTQLGTNRLLTRWLALSGASKTQMRQHAHQCFARRFNIDAVATRLLTVLRERVPSGA